MKPGAGKRKGGAFEREVCRALSLWVTNGKSFDVFWRSAMSGGRATVHGADVRQAGDIAAVAPEGHDLVERFYIECKNYRKLNVGEFIVKDTGPLANFWRHTCKCAAERKRSPMLIARQNNFPTLMLTYGMTIDRKPIAMIEGQRPIMLHLFDEVVQDFKCARRLYNLGDIQHLSGDR